MAEAVLGRYEVVFRLLTGITLDELVKHRVVGVSEEGGAHIGVGDHHVAHAVVFLLAAGELMPLDDAFVIVVSQRAYDNAVLRPVVHCLGVKVIVFSGVLHQPAFS